MLYDASPSALFRLHVTYLWRHHRILRLAEPRTFTELVQRRKLTDRDPRMPLLADKVRVKDHVAAELGDQWVIPTLWEGSNLPPRPAWPLPFVVKSRHGCNQSQFVLDPDVYWAMVRRDTRRWMGKTYGFWLDEWLYSEIPRGLLVEPFVGCNGAVPVDYKFYVFGGEVAFIQVHLGRGCRHRWILFDPSWKRVSAVTDDADPNPPRSLTEMIEAAEWLGRDLDFIRVDLYEPEQKPLFGEITFYPGSGLDPFDPVELDWIIGAEWLRVLEGRRKKEMVAAGAGHDPNLIGGRHWF